MISKSIPANEYLKKKLIIAGKRPIQHRGAFTCWKKKSPRVWESGVVVGVAQERQLRSHEP